MTAASWEIVIGNSESEAAAMQLLAVTHKKSADWAGANLDASIAHTIVPLFVRSADYLCLLSLAAPSPPLEVLALAARSTFELFTRLKYVLLSEEHAKRWRSEAAKDQLEIYDAILTIGGENVNSEAIRVEIDRVKDHALIRGLDHTVRILPAADVAKEVGLQKEYRAFYKLYSKLVHPSSFSVNWPKAAASEIYRNTFVLNTQVYAKLMLVEMESRFRMPVNNLRNDSLSMLKKNFGAYDSNT